MIYYVDIDGTILDTKNGDYENSMPMRDRIDKMNTLKHWCVKVQLLVQMQP